MVAHTATDDSSVRTQLSWIGVAVAHGESFNGLSDPEFLRVLDTQSVLECLNLNLRPTEGVIRLVDEIAFATVPEGTLFHLGWFAHGEDTLPERLFCLGADFVAYSERKSLQAILNARAETRRAQTEGLAAYLQANLVCFRDQADVVASVRSVLGVDDNADLREVLGSASLETLQRVATVAFRLSDCQVARVMSKPH